ncbi:hypothetical protein [Campylobacter cuniculorum]|uniref:Lipoprotein n=2 Tax=Campylobacter cuniculorum TaxID=374106 RepID=A0ABX6TWT6_9BACT|nr:putative lipoprotein [Campylobacter cuniculorum DSM 23162 = LMG 24588]QOR03633.1 hypothetical protein A0071_05390 [Campylobacter cuniculorum]
MKKYALSMVFALFLSACGKTSSSFINVSMPNFKPQTPIKTETPHSGVKISLEAINIEQNNNYSDYFENSTLKFRIDKEIELLKQNLEEQMKTIARLKGYELSSTNADYKLQSTLSIYIEEKNAQKTSEWLNGDSISSNLALNFQAKMEFIDAHNPQNITNITSNAKTDSFVSLTYPVKSGEGVGLFKTTFSAVPTQLNKGLERPAFEIDKAFLAFYKTTLNTLYENLPQALNSNNENNQGNQEFNEFINDESFNETFNENQNSQNSSEKSHKNTDGVIIFE